ncbi:hypothetical protein LguiA_025191 [Lonicera macranthoides]
MADGDPGLNLFMKNNPGDYSHTYCWEDSLSSNIKQPKVFSRIGEDCWEGFGG